jgi:hypothetical protein
VWTGEQSSLLTRTATMESVSLFPQMKKLTAFLELESAISTGLVCRVHLAF